MTRTEALKLLIEKCPEIVGPMLPDGYKLVYGMLSYRFDSDGYTPESPMAITPPDWFYLALEASMGRWLRDRHCHMRQYGKGQTMIELWPKGVYEKSLNDPDPFTVHALAVIELAAKEVQQ